MLNVLDAKGHSETARLALTPVGIKEFRVTLGAKPSYLNVFFQHPRFHKLVLGNCPKVKVIRTHLKSRKFRGEFLLPVAKLRTAWAKGRPYPGNDIRRVGVVLAYHELNSFGWNILDTPTPTRMDYTCQLPCWIVK
jgi:hypothetical protein